MNILLFGASGGTGRSTLRQAVAAGHRVSAFVRDPAAVAGEEVRTIAGDATDPAAVAAALPGHDAVLCTLGVRKSFRSGGLIAKSLAAIVPAAERHGVRRFVQLSALGVGTTLAQAPLLPRLLYALLLREIFRDKAAGETILCRSSLDWTVVYPPLLTDGPLTASYRAAPELALSGFPTVSRHDVAHFLVRALESPDSIGRHVIVSD